MPRLCHGSGAAETGRRDHRRVDRRALPRLDGRLRVAAAARFDGFLATAARFAAGVAAATASRCGRGLADAGRAALRGGVGAERRGGVGAERGGGSAVRRALALRADLVARASASEAAAADLDLPLRRPTTVGASAVDEVARSSVGDAVGSSGSPVDPPVRSITSIRSAARRGSRTPL
jgi:hypothetical protein